MLKNKENDTLIKMLKDAHANVYVHKHDHGHQISQMVLEDLKNWLNT